ncbi:Avidin family protein [Mycena indigotica]|uniref:Avidin family protein n=1 Tax=Mycena indigotica TaxID=2126181 RepID=A0A8H6SEM3_9AGAR|nr:Avidin family protein [Mycena indigotica]KAF7297532.1 Avidin family protein [Mycena indigotica]
MAPLARSVRRGGILSACCRTAAATTERRRQVCVTVLLLAPRYIYGLAADRCPNFSPQLPPKQLRVMSVGAAFDFTRLTRVWFNELASVMNLTANAAGGLSGTYNSAVGTAEDEYVLTGRFDTTPPSGTGVALGWVVAYKNSLLDAHSTAAWSGQFYAGATELEDIILTQWLLTTSTTPANNWESTNVNTDTFMPVVPTTAEVQKAQARGAGSPTAQQIVAKNAKRGE